jgi:hypothetical protein
MKEKKIDWNDVKKGDYIHFVGQLGSAMGKVIEPDNESNREPILKMKVMFANELSGREFFFGFDSDGYLNICHHMDRYSAIYKLSEEQAENDARVELDKLIEQLEKQKETLWQKRSLYQRSYLANEKPQVETI